MNRPPTAPIFPPLGVCPDATRAAFASPTVELRRLVPPDGARVFLKLEFCNPVGSVKARSVRAMIDAALHTGELTAKTRIVEATSGAEGVALAFVAAVRGLDATIVAPDSISETRIRTLTAFGAKLILTPKKLGMTGALREAAALEKSDSNVWSPKLFENPANVAAHEATTGPEIWRALGAVDVFVAGVGSGGTFVGVSRALRRRIPGLRTVAVEPAESPALSGGKPGAHSIVGIGAGFVPKIFDPRAATDFDVASTEEARETARRLAREEGIFAGISTGAAVAVALRLSTRPELRGKTIVAIAPDGAAPESLPVDETRIERRERANAPTENRPTTNVCRR